MNTPIKIYCRNLGRELEVAGGASLAQVGAEVASELGFMPICAHVNNKTESLLFEVYRPKEVEFLGVDSASGRRTYVRSLAMVLYTAARQLWPQVKLKIGQHVSEGYFCSLTGVECNEHNLGLLTRRMHELVERDLPFERFERPTEEVIDTFRHEGLDDKALLLSTYDEPYKTYYRLDGVCDSYYGALAVTTGILSDFSLEPYKFGFLLCGKNLGNPDLPQSPETREKMFRAFTDYLDFNQIIGVSDVGELNRAVECGHSSQLITVAEALHDQAIGRICDTIAERYRRGGARIVLVAGPSSSGKTTTTMRLGVQLFTRRLRSQMISLDDYFLDRDLTPRDETGDYDFESLYALNLERFNSDLTRLLAGEEVELPRYNFADGRSVPSGKTLKLDGNSVLLIEGIHGLNPELTAQIDPKMVFKVYVSALTTLSIDSHNWIPTTDNRLLRRIIRDHKYRGTSAAETIRRWPSVRRGEERWIFPYQGNADATFNSSLLFELAVMRPYADEILRHVPNTYPEYAEAYRLRKFLSYFLPIQATMVPPTSLLREFLGGSSFHY